MCWFSVVLLLMRSTYQPNLAHPNGCKFDLRIQAFLTHFIFNTSSRTQFDHINLVDTGIFVFFCHMIGQNLQFKAKTQVTRYCVLLRNFNFEKFLSG